MILQRVQHECEVSCNRLDRKQSVNNLEPLHMSSGFNGVLAISCAPCSNKCDTTPVHAGWVGVRYLSQIGNVHVVALDTIAGSRFHSGDDTLRL